MNKSKRNKESTIKTINIKISRVAWAKTSPEIIAKQRFRKRLVCLITFKETVLDLDPQQQTTNPHINTDPHW
jgi:hypothetical protein